MMAQRLSFISTLVSLGLIAVVNAQHNITVNNTSPSITYGGGVADVSICKYNPDGTIVSSQAGCYNIPSQCTEGVSFGQGGDGTAEFSFKGSAVYINSALDQLSPIYTVTLDGEATDVDGVRDSRPFSCYTLFSKTGLDPAAQHQIKLSVKGASPNRNQSIPDSDTGFAFSLISIIYTSADASDASNDTSSKSSSSPSSASSSSATTSGAPAASSSSAAEMPHVPGLISAGVAALAGFVALGL